MAQHRIYTRVMNLQLLRLRTISTTPRLPQQLQTTPRLQKLATIPKLPTKELTIQSTETPRLQSKEVPKLRYANNPTELIIRIQKLCQTGNQLDLAIELVKSSSVRVATISVWTELFKLVLKYKKFSLSYKLFLEIKRRNIPIDLKFFHFYFYLISQSPRSTKNYSLDRLQSIWSQAQATMKKNKSPANQPIITALTSAYLNCLCSHGFTGHAFTLFNSLPSTSIDSSTIHQLSKSLTSSPEDLELARSLINQFNTATTTATTRLTGKPSEDQIQIDLRTTLHLASLFFKSNNQPTDQQFGAKILEERLGIQIETNQYQFWNKSKPPISGININKNNNNIINKKVEEEEDNLIKFNPGQFTTLLRMLLKIRKYALIRRLWSQITANRDLYLQRNSLDQTHCGLVMVAMGRCKAISEVESLLAWMIKSGDRRLKPNLDTLDKAVQAAWETEQLTSGIIILSSLTQTYEGLIRPGTSDSEHELIKLSKETTNLKPIQNVSNRALCTILQTAGRNGTTPEINRALMVLETFNRKLPERKTQQQIQQEHQEKEKGLYLSEDSEVTHLNDSNQNWKNLIEIDKYWFDQFLWVLTDLLDKVISRKLSGTFDNKRLEQLKEWRHDIDAFLASDVGQFRQLRSRIEVRANERLINKQSQFLKNNNHIRNS